MYSGDSFYRAIMFVVPVDHDKMIGWPAVLTKSVNWVPFVIWFKRCIPVFCGLQMECINAYLGYIFT